jgi:APA family basic amino acid/polyamine antiporter
LPATKDGHLGLGTGIGLIVSNMIGAGVLLSTGFMAQEMGPGAILLAWVFGIALALCGTRAYGAIAAASGRSGGEYRYLTDYFHPVVGCLAGAGSLVLGFAAPIAVDAMAIGAFAGTLGTSIDSHLLGAAVIVVLSVFHATGYRSSDRTQNALVAVKILLVIAFVVAGLSLGSWDWPAWRPPTETVGFPTTAFLANQYWIAFALSGWNAAIYAAGEFRDPIRDVRRAMFIGCLGVGILYVVVNWVFVANLTPELATVVFEYEETRVTLGHAIMEKLIGPTGGALMSIFVIVAFLAAISAMTLVGPRVYAEMARDGYIPSLFEGRDGRPPAAALFLQTGVALGLLFTHSILDVVASVGALLMFFTALTSLVVFRIHANPELPDMTPGARIAAAVYAGTMGWCLFAGWDFYSARVGWAIAAILVLTAVFFVVERRRSA